MLKQEISDFVNALGQKQLLWGVDQLSPTQLESFLSQLKKYDSLTLKRQRDALFHPLEAPSPLEPLKTFARSGSEENERVGKELISQGKVGCLILAGGVGSRLGSNKPKALFPVSIVKEKTLLQLFLEKAVAASKQAKKPLPVGIMTSPLNHVEIFSYLEKQRRFGVKEENCSLFLQGTLPYLDASGNWLLENAGLLAEGADGNGNALLNFFNSGIWKKWKERGIEIVNVILIDNPLADPFDAELVGYHANAKADVTLKAILRRDEQEKVGVVGTLRGKLRVVEYTELPENQKSARDVDGSLLWKVANTSLFSFTMDFIESLTKNPQFYLPWHLAKKNAEVLQERPEGVSRERTQVWKCETFIFDLLNFAKNTHVLLFPRDEVYAPLKNAQGSDDLTSVQKALVEKERKIFQEISGKSAPSDRKIELDQAFYYPTDELLEKWRGKAFPQDQEYLES